MYVQYALRKRTIRSHKLIISQCIKWEFVKTIWLRTQTQEPGPQKHFQEKVLAKSRKEHKSKAEAVREFKEHYKFELKSSTYNPWIKQELKLRNGVFQSR